MIKLWKRRRWIVADLLNRSPRTCWPQLATWALDGHKGSGSWPDIRKGDPDHSCRAESLCHRDRSCWCGKFRDGKTFKETS